MAFQLTKADEDALSQVEIIVDGEDSGLNIRLNSDNLMFPPVVTKDSKTALWQEHTVGSYEPFKFYEQSQSRQLGIDFEWVTGGFKKDAFKAIKLHSTISQIKAYFYGVYFGGIKNRYPVVTINQLYEIIPRAITPLADTTAQGATFRLMNVDIKYSKEMTKVDTLWYPLHVKLSMSLESASQLGSTDPSAQTPLGSFKNIIKRPHLEWY